jgi:WD40 repeat protein
MLILEGHRGPVLSVAYAADSRTLASGGVDESVRLWDLAAGRVRRVLPDVSGPVTSLAFAPDGNTLAAGTSNCVTLWDVNTRQVGLIREGNRPGTHLVAFAPTGRIAIVAGFLDPHLTVWDTETDFQHALPQGHRSGVLALAHGFQHPVLVSGGGTHPAGELFVWDLGTSPLASLLVEPVRAIVPTGWSARYHYGTPPTGERTLVAAHAGAVYSVAISRDDALIASGGKDSVAKLWRRESGQVAHTLTGHRGTVVAVSFTPDGWGLLTADEGGTIRLWDTGSGRLRDSWDWKIGRLRSVVFSPDGMTAAAAGDNCVLVWDIDSLDR